jgi:hypothetical protein
MKVEVLVAIIAIFGFGFLAGYLLRALVSRRRRRWARSRALDARGPLHPAFDLKKGRTPVPDGVLKDTDSPSLAVSDAEVEQMSDKRKAAGRLAPRRI